MTPLQFYVNGKLRDVVSIDNIVSYKDVVRFAGLTGTPTVTFRRGRHGADGTMGPGDRVVAVSGMVFNVGHTGAA